MAIALFITPNELKQSTIIDGSVDPDIIVPFIELAQDVWIQSMLGTDLYTRLKAGIIADDLTAAELTLWNDYIKKPLIYYTAADFLPFSSYQIKQAGTYKHNADNSQNADKSEVDALTQKYTQIAQRYADRLVKYLNHFSSTYPQYNTNTSPDVYPSRFIQMGGFRFTKEKNTYFDKPQLNWNEDWIDEI